MAEAGKAVTSLGVPRRDAAEWPLQRYGRFMLSGTGELSGSGPEAGAAPSPTWKVFDSNEESGYLVLTIVISGHFFISQGQTLLEGFSLIGSKNWLKIVRRVDCLLFGSTIKNKSRMFRVQFAGESKEQALEHCCSCVQSLAQYITVEVPDSMAQLSPGLLWAGDRQGRDGEQSVALQPGHLHRRGGSTEKSCCQYRASTVHTGSCHFSPVTCNRNQPPEQAALASYRTPAV
ncbi:PREDICTED: meiotic recombination protein REC114 isoform X3 [Chinchilla lanigera]|uniref:meiotic recombination protein REC114 isoform X3 n=1 Tax=Chinchilla lanigera TaxID=34839 RepID=UPI00038EDF74|nr:PREDICTED: meiotic recombination protein REC114 isoform X3 [Chinchilla lanigera]